MAQDTRRALGRMIAGYNQTQILYVAAKLGLAELLATGPRGSDEMAGAVGAEPAALYRLLRALAQLGVVQDEGGRRFSLTPIGTHLREEAPGSLRAAAICAGEAFYDAWGDLLSSVRSGETAFDRVHGMPFFDYYGRHPEAGEQFNRYMTGVSAEIAAALVASYDFSAFGSLVDVGGGQGTLLAAILTANPRLAGALYDLPSVIESARPRMAAAGVSGRCELIAGDFFAAVPAGRDAYVLKWILHDWDDARAVLLLRNCRRAMSNTARLLIVETVLPERMTPEGVGATLDIHMLALTGGRERTEAEYRALFAASGFRLSRVVSIDPSAHSPLSGATVSIIEGEPAPPE